jgi:hypothetical protein
MDAQEKAEELAGAKRNERRSKPLGAKLFQCAAFYLGKNVYSSYIRSVWGLGCLRLMLIMELRFFCA